MEYLSLKKLYHIDEKKCHEIYKKRFDSESCRTLGIRMKDNECFYIVNEEMLNLIACIYSIDNWIEKMLGSHDFPNAAFHYMIMKTLIEEIKSSNKIEGIYSTRKELREMITNQPPQKYKRFYGMVNKYVKLTMNQSVFVETSLDVRNLYDEILSKDIMNEDKKDVPDGFIFRNDIVEIHSGSRVIHKGVIGEKNIIEMMDKALKILNDEKINLLIRVAAFHYLFEYIHPFYNGNGRMGRFLASAYLANHLNHLCAFQLSVACTHYYKKYYHAFEVTNDLRNKADLTVFIIQFLEIYLSGLEELKGNMGESIQTYHYLKRKMDLQINYKYAHFIEVLLQATLFGVEGLSISEITDVTTLTEPTIRKIVRRVNQNQDIILIDKKHRPYRYRINIDLIANDESDFFH